MASVWPRRGGGKADNDGPFLIVGLGNPGPRYERNRHNIGFQCLDRLASEHHISVTRKRFRALVGEGQIAGRRAVLLKPQTFMNDSGLAVAPAVRWYNIPPERILVIYDDLDLPLGKLRLRPGGSSGGHHGIESIIAELGSPDFIRARVGIGRPERGDPVDYVLGDFGAEQEPVIEETRHLVARAVVSVLEEGIDAAMNRYNGM